MADPFLSEIRLMSFNFAPKGWALCNGQILGISQNQALFALLGTTYGGNGQTNFALPDLRACVPMHFGSGHSLGERGGETAHTVTSSEMPQHTHVLNASSLPGNQAAPSTTSPAPATHVLASPLNLTYRAPDNALTTLLPGTISNVGGSQAHENRQPHLALTFCIALLGIFPSRN